MAFPYIINLSFYTRVMNIMKTNYLIAFWTPFPGCPVHSYSEIFSNCLKKYGRIQCIDCSDTGGKRNTALLRTADLVIVTLPQNRRLLDKYFSNPCTCFEHVLFLITDYFASDKLCRSAILHRYRIPQTQLLILSYTQRLCEAERTGRLALYLHRALTVHPDAESETLKTQLCRSAWKIFQTLERQLYENQ